MQVSNQSFAEAQEASSKVLADIRADPTTTTVLTGDRPTGSLHLGHYFGTLQNRIYLQKLGVQLFVLIADYQVFTDRDSAAGIGENVLDLLADYLAIGLRPEDCHIFAHSQVASLNQLLLPFLSLVSVAELQRNPTVKDEIRASQAKRLSGLMLSYPVHQAADILFCKGNVVPGGKDQLPHIELARVIARRFNERFADGSSYFPEPALLLSQAPSLLGTDGQKMSKSRHNSIAISASDDETISMITSAKTDSIRDINYDPQGRPEVSNLLLLGALCSGQLPEQLAAEVGNRGAAGLKAVVADCVNEYFRDIRIRRQEYRSDPAYLLSVLKAGNDYATEVANETLGQVLSMMGMDYRAG